ncbi:MAG TPA: aminotransferase class V-fold PLP-dependent enzyme [Cyclobacteriaceae bacterium]
MISFYPGPSRVYDDIPKYVSDAHRHGILSLNHRSDEFMSLCKETVSLLKEKLNIPKNYTILFNSSATECWEVLAQSLIQKESIHIYNGAFGEKWFDYTKRLVSKARSVKFDLQEELNTPQLIYKTGEVICVTQNETSNGTQISNEVIASVKKQNPNHLIAVDATSSMAGISLEFKSADIWFASVQKCFGLPAGLAVMVFSPKAMDRIKSIGERKHYNSLLFMNEMMDKWQTSCTPNVLGIYLLMRTLKKVKAINVVNNQTVTRFYIWEDFFKRSTKLNLLVENGFVRSYTVLTITGNPMLLKKVKANAQKEGLLLGEGYGAQKNETFRIANFPAIQEKEIAKLMKFLSAYL